MSTYPGPPTGLGLILQLGRLRVSFFFCFAYGAWSRAAAFEKHPKKSLGVEWCLPGPPVWNSLAPTFFLRSNT